MKIKITDMKKAADKAAELLKVLANPKRLMIVCRLSEGEASVNELAETLDMRASTVSQHLQILRLGGFVTTRRDAQTIYYSLEHNPSEDVIKALYKNYCIMPSKKKKSR
jgi:DNA-binding transcriptional ArsR family regulator